MQKLIMKIGRKKFNTLCEEGRKICNIEPTLLKLFQIYYLRSQKKEWILVILITKRRSST